MRLFFAVGLLLVTVLVVPTLLAVEAGSRAPAAMLLAQSPAAKEAPTAKKDAAPAAKPPAAKPAAAKAAEVKRIPDDENSCIQCHAALTEKEQKRFLVDPKDFAGRFDEVLRQLP